MNTQSPDNQGLTFEEHQALGLRIKQAWLLMRAAEKKILEAHPNSAEPPGLTACEINTAIKSLCRVMENIIQGQYAGQDPMIINHCYEIPDD